MLMKILYAILFISLSAFSQSKDLSVASIPAELQQNANAVVRSASTGIAITSQRSMTITTSRIVTVLNEEGLEHLNAFEHYSPRVKVRRIEATVYDAHGREIKRFKKKDFKDQSVSDGMSLFDHNRILFLSYTPTTYPFTLEFQSEIESSNTAFIPRWSPIDDYYVSTQYASLTITYAEGLGFRYKEVNLNGNNKISKTESPGKLQFEAGLLRGYKQEDYSPDFDKFAPVVIAAVDQFNLEGVDGYATSWEEFGKWYHDSLLTGTDEIPSETKAKVLALVGNEKDPVKIARIIYKYVQDKTRYVSVQVGIGGFKPMLAKDVDKLGYGDCKALSNYTRALLNIAGVPSYYTIVYAGRRKRDLMEDFVSVQGNHVILAIPDGDNLIWLECTSQTSPFGFQGTFTDDRNVLLITPEGGKLLRSSIYPDDQNRQVTTGQYTISDDGNMKGVIEIKSTGSQYDRSYDRERLTAEDRDKYYKERFANLNNLKLTKIDFDHDRINLNFTEKLQLTAAGYASKSGGQLIFPINAFNGTFGAPKRYRNRENGFNISRGFYDQDEIIVIIPEGYIIEALPQNVEYNSKYGEYKTTYITNPNDNTLTYKRSMLLKNGTYDSGDYEEYRLFLEKTARNDNAKIIISKEL
jgi:hypothetical protein